MMNVIRYHLQGSSISLAALIYSILALMPVSALAENRSSNVGVEITPFGGYSFGGAFQDSQTGTRMVLDSSSNLGLLLDIDLPESNKQIEAFWSRQLTKLSAGGIFTGNPLFDLVVDYFHIGGLYLFEGDTLQPFISGTVGITHIDPQRSDLSSETRISLSLGGGAKVFFTKNIAIRVDLRGFYTALNSDTLIFCKGGCSVKVMSSGFLQGELGRESHSSQSVSSFQSSFSSNPWLHDYSAQETLRFLPLFWHGFVSNLHLAGSKREGSSR